MTSPIVWNIFTNNFDYASASGGGGGVSSITAENGVSASPSFGDVLISGINSTYDNVGVASFNPFDFSVDLNGHVSLIGINPGSYVNVNNSMSPYNVGSADYFISVDSTDGPVIINLPDTPTNDRQFIIKDRLGMSNTNSITITTIGGITTIDGLTSYTFSDNYESLEMLFQTNNYEVF